MQPPGRHRLTPVQRIRIWYGLLVILFAIFLVRLFYLQVIRYDYYTSSALKTQLRQYEISPERGVIEVQNGNDRVPIVLNEPRFTLFADPVLISNPEEAAKAVSQIIGGGEKEYESKMQAKDSRYEVLAKRLTKEQRDALLKLELKGVLTKEVPQRTYPQGTLGAQLLGFVDDEGIGKYGLEQALDDVLKGSPGQLKAITDARGVPLAANKDNIITEPQHGERVLLTIDLGMQQHLETILKEGVESAKSSFGSAVIMDVRNGGVKAMANYPSYNPAEFYNVPSEHVGVFENAVVSTPLEVGSIMKPLTLAAALDQGVVNRDSSYYDKGFVKVDGATITNVEEAGGPGPRTMGDILQQSLNTGATWLLMQMGGGDINERARTKWHEYLTDHYQFGKLTGIEQGYESPGSLPNPQEGFGLNIQFANTAFGQGMTATPLQMAAALSSVVNGGTYYQPRLVEGVGYDKESANIVSQPKIVRQNVVGAQASKDVRDLMEYAFSKNHRVYGMANLRPEFTIGGKTGTAQIPKPDGGYYEDRYNGMFMGFVGGNEAQYVIVVRVDEPKIGGYAGSKAAGPIFVKIANTLLDNFSVTPKN
jgi:cell division protein FtsI/penicillin-binding protein 2